MNLKDIFRKPLNTLEGTGLIKSRDERIKAKEEKSVFAVTAGKAEIQ